MEGAQSNPSLCQIDRLPSAEYGNRKITILATQKKTSLPRADWSPMISMANAPIRFILVFEWYAALVLKITCCNQDKVNNRPNSTATKSYELEDSEASVTEVKSVDAKCTDENC